jgi:hypothetical protein
MNLAGLPLLVAVDLSARDFYRCFDVTSVATLIETGGE